MADLQVKRGRPKKISDEDVQVIRKMNKNHKEQYNNTLYNKQILYAEEQFSQDLKRMLLRIPVVTSFPKEAQMSPLEYIIDEAAKQNMISKVELVLSSVYLNKFYEKCNFFSVDEIINSVFFFAKSELEKDQVLLNALKISLQLKYKNLNTILAHLAQLAPISPPEINKQFKILNESRVENINYLYYIDEILRKSPPYKSKVKDLKKKSLSKGKEKKGSDECKKFAKFSNFSDILPLSQSDLEIVLSDEFIDCDTWFSSKDDELNDSDLDLLLDLN